MCEACNTAPADLAGLVELTPEQYRQVEGNPLDNLARTLGATIAAMLAVAEAMDQVANNLEATATAIAKQRERNYPAT